MTVSTLSFHPQNFARSTDRQIAPVLSDDECVSLLARAVDDHDDRQLNEVAQLIGRLAVPIE